MTEPRRSGGGGGSWTRVRESQSRKDYVRFRFGSFGPPHAVPARERRLSLIDVSFRLQTEALGPSCKMTLLKPVQAHGLRAAT